ncbi:hybrid signal transduction histidine kinase M [Tanacetum coccineum]
MCRRVLKDLFHDKKEARTMELYEELRPMELGNLSIAEYCKKASVTADLLANIDSAIEDKNLVIYVINGLSDRYEHVASKILQSKTLLTLLETRSMLLLEESRIHGDEMGSQGICNRLHAVQVCKRGRDVGSMDNQKRGDACI